ncbi:glycosyltransferase [Rubrobacter marinus]|uniref:Glycosyltransferase n=1 Tax=Rubrobacter marinus TaxID=2653852 RepID=A0A6G8Q1F7_9ACTN|nr:glycosyltransferase [Rubrobacter marinus]QIN80306.1 glycosyltransferase [Rubrobacter marinus]
MAAVDVLLPTYNRRESLLTTLAGLAGQSFSDLRVVVADQSTEPAEDSPVARAMERVIRARGGSVEWHHRETLLGIAEQRDFLLNKATAPYVLYLDDDIFMEPWVLERLVRTLEAEACGFVGAFPAGLTFAGDVRPEQQVVEPWEGPVRPEVVEPGTPEWERWNLHRAANVYHAAGGLRDGEIVRYKVAWVAACILYDREKLLEVGGFSFWESLPRYPRGEEILVQNLLMRRYGGCAILPSGTYSNQVETTVAAPGGTVDEDGDALKLLPEMVARYAPPAT